MPNAPAVVKFTEAFFDLHKVTAPAGLKNDLIMAGMTVNKGGYHSQGSWLLDHKPGDYSIQRSADRYGAAHSSTAGYGAAVDITFRSAQGGNYTMISHYMRLAANGLRSPAVYADDGVTNTFREMIGTIDGKKPVTVSFYREALLAQDDRSHMYHIHFSFTRRWLNDFSVYMPLLGLLFPLRPKPPQPFDLLGLNNTIMEEDMPLQLVQAKGDDAVYALAPTGAIHVKNPTHLALGQKYGLFTKDRAEITVTQLRELREIEPEGVR